MTVISSDIGRRQATINVGGAWQADLQDTRRSEGRPGSVEFNMILMQEGESIGGTFSMSLPGEVNLMGAVTGVVSGNRVMLVTTVVEPNYVNKTTLTANLKDGRLKGEYAGSDNTGKLWTGRFTASKKIAR
ncbi:hypothetical protein ACFLZM_04330 [Thermodesulfobacteriota bacterium]